jgi:hypothetical protein
MEPERSLPHSQVPATCPYPEPAQSSPYPHIPLLKIIHEPALYRLLTFQVPNLMSLFRCLVCTKVSVRVRGFVCEYFVTKIRFHREELLAPRPTPKLEDHPCQLSATAYSIYLQRPSILEDIPPSATWGHAMPWWQRPTYRTVLYLLHIQKF